RHPRRTPRRRGRGGRRRSVRRTVRRSVRGGTRMRTTVLALCAALVLLPGRAQAQSRAPDCGGLDNGYRAWAESGPADAVRLWLEGSVINSGREELVGALGRLEGMFGRVRGYEVMREVMLAPSLKRIYVLALHTNAPSYGYFDCYHTGGRWTVTNIQLHSKASEILPPDAFWLSGPA